METEILLGELKGAVASLTSAVKDNAKLAREDRAETQRQIGELSVSVNKFVISTNERLRDGDRRMDLLAKNQRWGFGLLSIAVLSLGLFLVTDNPVVTWSGLGMTFVAGIFHLVVRN